MSSTGLFASESSGYGHSGGYGHSSSGGGDYKDECCPLVVDLLCLVAIIGAIAGAAVLLGRVIAIEITGRKKRSLDIDYFWNFLIEGLEEFENKIEALAGSNNNGTDPENEGWMSKLYHKFKDAFEGDDNLIGDLELDGLEPPNLLETWGLHDVRTLYNENSTLPGNSTEHALTKRSLFEDEDVNLDNEADEDEDDDYLKSLKGDAKCNAKFWNCVGKVVKGGMHYMEEPGGVWRVFQKTMFRMAFHGKYGNVWNALMTNPEARGMKRCMNMKQSCLSYEILRKEAETDEGENPRLLVNPDFVQSLDQSDGADQYDPEASEKYKEWLLE